MEQRGARTWPRVALMGACVALLVIVGYRLVQESAGDRDLEAFRAKYRALGYPVTIDELKEAHEVPEGEENVAPLLLAALDRIDESDVDYDNIPILGNVEELPPPGEPLPAKIVSESQYFLSINEEALGEIRQLIREPHCNFPIDWDNYFHMEDIGRLAEMRNLARIFALRALILGDAGDGDGAIDAIEDIFLLGAVEQSQPTYISYLVGVAISGIGTAYVETLLESVTLNDEQLLHLSDVVRWAKARHNPVHSLLGDYILAEHWIDNMRDTALVDFMGGPLSLMMDNAYVLAGLEAHDARASRQSLDSYLELFQMPLSEALDREETLNTPSYYTLFPMGKMRESGMIGRSGVGFLFARYQVLYNAILASLQVERYRLEEGVLPTSLEDLVPKYLDEVPLDPYDGGPLRFRAVGESYVVYSVGCDRVDDGGYDFEADEAMRPMQEIAFVVRRPSGEAR